MVLIQQFLPIHFYSNPRGTPYNGLYGEAPPERGTFLRLRYIKRVGISLYCKFSCSLATLVEVYKTVGNSDRLFYGCEIVEKTFCFCDCLFIS